MNWIDKEKKEIEHWAGEKYSSEKSDNILQRKINKSAESYWTQCEQTGTISEYYFDQVAEFKKLLSETVDEDLLEGVLIPVMAATFKGKVVDKAEAGKENTESKIEIPEYIYTI